MTEAIELDLRTDESVVLDLDDTETVELNITEEVISLEVLGEVGPRGLPGLDSGFYRHEQGAPAATWIIAHNLGYRPAITTTDSAGSVVQGNLYYIDENNARVEFDNPFGGYAECS